MFKISIYIIVLALVICLIIIEIANSYHYKLHFTNKNIQLIGNNIFKYNSCLIFLIKYPHLTISAKTSKIENFYRKPVIKMEY